MKFSIQIVNFNSRDYLRSCLLSIGKTAPKDFDLEVVVINNDSELLEDDFLRGFNNSFEVKVIEAGGNFGFGKAHNLGFKKVQGDYVLFLNPDTRVFPNSIPEILRGFAGDKKIGVVGPILVKSSGKVQLGSCGWEKTPFSIIRDKFVLSDELDENLNEVREVDWVSGGALAVRREIFEGLGGFDENYFMYFEDVDFCLRARKSGYKVVINPKAKIFHYEGGSFASDKDKKKFYYQSQDYYLKKNFGFWKSAVVKVVRFPYYFKNVYLSK